MRRELAFEQYQAHTEHGTMEDGAVLEWQDGCDGQRHASALYKIFLDAEGKAEFAEPPLILVRGTCDKSCLGKPRTGGFF